MPETADKNLDTIEANKELFDVIIIGAGVSGSTAAYTLKQKCPSLKILVLEAKDRVGGRTQTVEMNCSTPGKKVKVDAGGQWVADTQETITALLKELNIETYPQFDTGTKILETDEKLVKYNGTIPSLSAGSLMEIMLKMSKINNSSKKVPTLNPFKNIRFAQDMDSLNIDQFLNQRGMLTSVFNSVACRGTIESAFRVVFGLELNQLNTLYGLMFVNAGGSIERLTLTEKGCAQEKRVKGGTQQISQKLIDAAGHACTLLLNTAVTEVVHDFSKVGVDLLTENMVTKRRVTYGAKYVISSMPINQYAGVSFSPELPAFKRNVFRSVQMGSLTKFVVTYRRAFWRERGFSGEVVSDGSVISLKPGQDMEERHQTFPSIGPINVVYDATTYDGEPALVGFIGGRPAVEWLDQSSEVRKTEILSALVRYFGNEASDHIDFMEKVWSDEKFSGGCPVTSVSSAGVMKDYVRATREPFHNVHFCGTESALQWQGYIDGAAESGVRAANEVLYRLSQTDASVVCDYDKTYYFQCEQLKRQRQIEQNELTWFDYFFGLLNSVIIFSIVSFYTYIILAVFELL